MPIPFILGGLAIGATLFGAKKGHDAYKDMQSASNYHEEASLLYLDASNELEEIGKKTQETFETLGKLQTDIIEDKLYRYAELVDKFEIESSLDLADIVGEETMDNLDNVRLNIVSLETTLATVAMSGSAGALAGFGAFGGAGLMATASTGTAISTLSGAAATNATLAWFGGGSLAAGGFGIAGGTLVLGSIVAAPVIAVATSVFAANAEKKKYEALAYKQSIEVLCENMRAEGVALKAIKSKANEKNKSLKYYGREFERLLTGVESTAAIKGIKISEWNEIEQKWLKSLMQIAETVLNIINAPVMNDDDALTKRIIKYQTKCKDLMDEIQRKWG